MNNKIAKKIEVCYPIFAGVAVTGCVLFFKITHDIKNFANVLDTIITFSSIVTGFLAALLGILVSIKDSYIVKAIFESREKGILKYYFYETFTIGFILVITSGIMHVLIGYDFKFTLLIFYLWTFLTFWFFPSTYRIVSILLSVLFKANNKPKDKRPDSNKLSEDETDKMKRNLTRDLQ